MRDRAPLVSAALACALLSAAACSDESSPRSEGAGEKKEQASAREPRACPLTGERFPPDINALRAAVAVKVENSREARPQSGLEDADLVYEQIVEGGITRFMAIYHCGNSKKAGPVRSARFDDAKLALPFTRILAYSGSNGIVEKELKRQGLVRLNELNAGDAFFRVPPGTLETHNLFVNVAEVRARAPERARKPPPQGLFEFGSLEGKLEDSARRVRSVTVKFNPSNAITWRWKGGVWKRWEGGEPFLSKSGRQIAVPNVLLQQVEVNNSKQLVDVAGNPSPHITLVGRGKAWLLRDGRAIKGTWKTTKAGAAPTFTTKDGERFRFDRGPIWVELVPSPKGDLQGLVALK